MIKVFITVNDSDLGAAASHIQWLSRIQVASHSYFYQVIHIQVGD